MVDPLFRCPEATCTGWVSEVQDDDEEFWGCGECGTIWEDLNQLFEAISEVIERYPYRKNCYAKTRTGWHPVALDKEPADYEELVDQEWEDDDGSFADDDGDESEYPFGVDESCYRCPVSRCSGWVGWTEQGGFDGDKPAWECGWCGSTWYDKSNLLNEIEAIIAEFSYRQACYIGSKGGRKPAPIENHAPGYDNLVDKEPNDTLGESERG